MSNKRLNNATADQLAATPALSTTKIPADLVIEIFKKLPAAYTLARLRCVCRSWRALLSDPAFLRQILVIDQDRDDDSRRIMIFRLTEDQKPLFSPCSYDTLLPLSADPPRPVHLSTAEGLRHGDCHIVGYDNGIFCLGDGIEHPCGLHLYNPATLEAKALPPSPFTLIRELCGYHHAHMFGFDSKGNDYKLIRLRKVSFSYWRNRFEQATKDEGVSFAEVYSLRNDSWTKVDTDVNLSRFFYAARSVLECHDGKCYRWDREYCNETRMTRVLSFDLAKEVFEMVEVFDPPATPSSEPAYWHRVRRPRHITFLKGSMAVVFQGGSMLPHSAMLQIWVMLKYGVADSWVKLYDVPRGNGGWDYYMDRPLGLWKDWKCVFVKQKTEGELGWTVAGGEVLVFDPETRDVVGLEVRTDSKKLRIIWDYVPATRVSLVGFADTN